MTEKLVQLSLDEILGTLTEGQAKFLLHASVVAGHLPRYWLDQGIILARMTKHG